MSVWRAADIEGSFRTSRPSLAISFCLLASMQAGCERTQPRPPNVVDAEYNAAGTLVVLHLNNCDADNSGEISSWLSTTRKDLRTLTIESCEFSDDLLSAMGGIEHTETLNVWSSPGWLQGLGETARSVNKLSVSASVLQDSIERPFQNFPMLRTLQIVSGTQGLEGIRFENLSFLVGLHAERLEVVARSIVVQDAGEHKGIEGMRSATFICDADASDLAAVIGDTPIHSLTWARVILKDCAAPRSGHFSRMGNWSELRTLWLMVHPEGSRDDWTSSCGTDCPESIRMELGGEFEVGIRQALQLRSLTLTHATLSDGAWKAIAGSPQLASLEMHCCDAGDAQLAHLLNSESRSFPSTSSAKPACR
jgi:hypothetical protein